MYLCCLVVLLGSMSVGTMLGLSSPLIPDIQKDTSKVAPHLTVSEASWFGVSSFQSAIYSFICISQPKATLYEVKVP